MRRTDIVFTGLACAILASAIAEPALAQAIGKSPFGVGDTYAGGGPATGLTGWILAKQAEFTRAMISALRATTTGGGAGALLTVAFLYGVFHAAGPGHGKAIVSSYVFANEQALRRGISVAVAAAILQALVAIALVVPAVLMIGATARQIDASVAWIEIVTFAAILLLGLSLTYRKFKAFLLAIGGAKKAPAVCAQCGPGLRYTPSTGAAQPAPACTHVHLPSAASLSGERSWKDLAAAAFAAGSRPCTGAIILLSFALSVSALPVGIAAVFAMAAGTALTTSAFAAGAVLAKGATARIADRSERWRPLTAGIELAAAILVALLGGALLTGYMAGLG